MTFMTSKHFFVDLLLQAIPYHIWTSYISTNWLADLAFDFRMDEVTYCGDLTDRMYFVCCTKGKPEIESCCRS